MVLFDPQLLPLVSVLYVLWLWIRSSRIIVCLFRLVTGLLSQRFIGRTAFILKGTGVCKVVAGINDARCWDDDILPESPDDDYPDGSFVFGHRRHVIDGDQFLELRRGCQLLFTKHSLLCSVKRLEGYKFVTEHTHVFGKFTTAKQIDVEDAIVLLANGHCAVECRGETLITSSYSDPGESHLNLVMLAILPLVLQVNGHSFAAAFVLLAVLGLDLFRPWLSRAYIRLSDFVLTWVKLNLLQSWSRGYEVLSIFSPSWLYTDEQAKCAYKSKGPFYCIYGSLLKKDGFSSCTDYDDLENMFRIEVDRAQWLPTSSDRNLGAVFLFKDEILVA